MRYNLKKHKRDRQKAGLRSQESGVRSQKSGVRSQKSEVRSQKSEVGWQVAGVRRQELQYGFANFRLGDGCKLSPLALD
jgi:hypothetical protein